MVGSALCVELPNRHSSRLIRPEIISGKAKRTMATHAVLPSTSLHIPSIFAMSFPAFSSPRFVSALHVTKSF